MDHPSSPPADQAAINVLVVDDEAVIASEIVEFLSFEHIGAVAAKDGQQALHCLDTASPGAFTVMITDVRMPGINGLELASDVRAKASEANAIEVILMTGHGSHKVVQEATRIPAFECMAKPLSLSHLLSTIRRAHAATVVRRTNHRESVDDVVRLLEQAQKLAARPLTSPHPGGKAGTHSVAIAPGRPDWSLDPLSFVLAPEGPAEPGATAADSTPSEAVLDHAAEQARTLLPAIKPLTELILGRRRVTRTAVPLRAFLEAAVRRHPGSVMPIAANLQDRTLQIDEQVLSAILDQVIDDVARSGPKAAPIRLEAELGDSSVKLRAIGGATGPIMHEAQLSPGTAQAVHCATADTGSLGLRIAAAASRLLGGTIDRKGTCNGYSTTTVILGRTAVASGPGVD